MKCNDTAPKLTLSYFKNKLYESLEEKATPGPQVGVIELMKLYTNGTPEEISGFETLVNQNIDPEKVIEYIKQVVGGMGDVYKDRFA